jgi:hypothetical protein
MPHYSLLLLLLVAAGTPLRAQTISDIFTSVDTLFMPGAALGSLSPDNPRVTPIVSNSPCETPLLHYAVVTPFQGGRVAAIAHESLLSDGSLSFYDNRVFVSNIISWLSADNRQVSLKPGWVNGGNTDLLQASLLAANYSFDVLGGDLSTAALANTDVLILGNDWNGGQPYEASELVALETFVANGGSLFIAGLGWSWPGELSSYPMNQVATLFGFAFTTQIIRDGTSEGDPKLYNFYPDNLNTTQAPYCPSPFVGTNLARGEHLRVLRLAVSTTGEFTTQNGGVAATSQLIDQWLNTINETYGREYCVRFELIPNNDLMLFPDAATDPWETLPPGSGGCTNAGLILNDQFNVFNSFIGSTNYDISHVIAGSPFGGGCAANLQRGLSGGLSIPVTRHEMGHQLAQSHTINNNGNNNYEPENGGWTIQGGNRFGHAHAVSYHQLADFLLNEIPTIGTRVPTGNTIPAVDAGPDLAIPISTPFVLSGSATDPDPNDRLTYVWDNLNRGIAQQIPVGDDSQGALFMRLLPDTSASRTIPRMEDVIQNNNTNAQEQLPTQARILDIRLTVNDNHQIPYGGELVNASGTHSDDIQITVADAGPFVVTSQAVLGLRYPGGTEQTVSWAVNGTDLPPINTQYVSLSLSTDGGYTYPITLLARTPNDGNATVLLPNITTTTARIKVAAVDNIYFDINPVDFEIQMQPVAASEVVASESVKLVPNPAGDFFRIAFSSPQAFRARLYNAQGQLVRQQMNKPEFDTAGLADGFYLLLLTDLDQHTEIRKRLLILR